MRRGQNNKKPDFEFSSFRLWQLVCGLVVVVWARYQKGEKLVSGSIPGFGYQDGTPEPTGGTTQQLFSSPPFSSFLFDAPPPFAFAGDTRGRTICQMQIKTLIKISLNGS